MSPLCVPRRRYHIGSIMNSLTEAVVRALRVAPCSLRALARIAGVSHVQLLHITQGKRRATVAVARKVAKALDGWSKRCRQGADRILKALSKGSQ